MTNYYLQDNGVITQSANFKFSDNCLETQEEIVRDELSGQLYLQSDYNNLIITQEYQTKVTAHENLIRKTTLQAQIEELEKKQFRSAKAKFSSNPSENDLTYYNNYEAQINALREELSSL